MLRPIASPLPVLTALVLFGAAGCAAPEPEAICKHHDELFLAEVDKLAPADGSPADAKLRETALREHKEREKKCLLSYSQIKNVSSFSKWKQFAECDLKATSTDGLKECPPLLK